MKRMRIAGALACAALVSLVGCGKTPSLEEAGYFDFRDGSGGSCVKILKYSEVLDFPDTHLGVPVCEIAGMWGDLDTENAKKVRSVHLPVFLQRIGEDALAFTGIEEVDFPQTLREIEAGGFRYCEKLKEVVLPNSLVTMEQSAFSFCTSLKSVVLSDSLTELPTFAFYQCARLRDVTGGNALETIGYAAFAGTWIESFSAPASLKGIAESAFEECFGLTSLSLNEGLETIGEEAFSACSSLTECVVPSSVRGLAPAVFSGCTALRSAKLLCNLTVIPRAMFFNCEKLESVELGACQTLADTVFSGCTALEHITLPEDLREIGFSAFYDCDSLTEFVLPAGLETIRRDAFADCDSLRRVEIGHAVRNLGWAFRDTPLQEIVYDGTQEEWEALIGADAEYYAGISVRFLR